MDFVVKLTKEGHSYKIYIPKHIIKALGVDKGDLLQINIKKVKLDG